MRSTAGSLDFDSYIQTDQFKSDIQFIKKQISGVSTHAAKETERINASFKQLGQMAAGYFAFDQLSGLPKQLINIRGEFQNLEIAYKTMLGSKAEADKLMAQVTKFAATTPFDLKGVASASKMLLAYGFAASDVTKVLTRLGDISAGLNIPLGELTELYGKTKVEGRVMAEDLNQYVGRGIPLIKLLADQFEVAESEVRGLVEQGKVGFPEVEKAIKKLTDSGGTFAGLMAEQSKGLLGLYSNFEDSIDQMFNKIGKEQEGLLAGSISFATTVVEHYEPILDVLKVIIATYGAYKAAVIATAAVQALAVKGGAIMAWLELATTIRSAKDAQIAFNLATKANPYALAASALIALITAVSLFSKESNEATKSQARALEITERMNQKHAEETTKVQLLAKQISDESLTREVRNKKLQELISLSPEHFKALTIDSVATTKGADAIRDYTNALEKKLALQAREEQIIANNKRIRDINTGVSDDEFEPNIAERALLFLQDSGLDEKKFKGELEKRKNLAVKALQDQNTELLKEAAKDAANAGKEIPPPKVVTPPKTKATKKAKTEKEEHVKTYSEELEEKKRLYELYERWVTNYGKEAADEQFNTLVARNKDYLTFLNNEIQRLSYVKDAGEMSVGDAADLDKLLTERSTLMGGKSALDKFRERLDGIRESSASVTEELIELKKIQDSLNPKDNSSDGFAMRQMAAERDLELQKERKQLLRDFLVSVAGSEESETSIRKKYADMRGALDKHYADKKADAYIKALGRIDEAEKKDLADDKTEGIMQSKGYKELERALAMTRKNDTGKRLELLRGQLAKLTVGTDEYYQKLLEVQQAEEDHRRHVMETWGAIAGMVGELGEALEGYGGAIGEIGSSLSGLASAATKVSATFANMDNYKTSEGKMSMDGYVAAAQNVIQIITGIIEAQKRRREAEKQFAAERLGFENDYALQLNKNLGKNYGDNPFYKDYEGAVKAGVDQYKDAFDKYQSAIDKLEEGKAKERQKNVVDGKTTLGMVGAGAATGAIIGAAVGGGILSVPAAAVGAVVGGVVGLIGGLFAKKKKDVFGSLMEQYPELVTETAEGWAELNIEMAQALITNNQVDDKTKEMLQNAISLNEAMQEAKQQIQDTMVELTGQVGDNLKNALVEAFSAGSTAAEAMHQTVSDMIADVTSKLLFSALVGPALDQLTQEMTKSLTQGDGAIVDDLVRFEQYGLPSVEKYFQGLEEFDKWAKEKGFDDVFNRSQGTDQAMQGVIKGVSEETVSLLVGQTNAIRIYQAQMAFDTRTAVLHLTQISHNTSFNKYLVRLEGIENTLNDIKKGQSLRGNGL